MPAGTAKNNALDKLVEIPFKSHIYLWWLWIGKGTNFSERPLRRFVLYIIFFMIISSVDSPELPSPGCFQYIVYPCDNEVSSNDMGKIITNHSETEQNARNAHLSAVKWASWLLESPACRLYVQQFVQTNFKVNINAHRSQRANNTKNVSISWLTLLVPIWHINMFGSVGRSMMTSSNGIIFRVTVHL